MTEIIVGIEQLLNLLKKEDVSYGISYTTYGNHGIIETEKAIVTWRRL